MDVDVENLSIEFINKLLKYSVDEPSFNSAYNQPNWIPGKTSIEKQVNKRASSSKLNSDDELKDEFDETGPYSQLPKSSKKSYASRSHENKENNSAEKRTKDSQIFDIEDDSSSRSSQIANPSKRINQNDA
jgi:hypothetical protein